MDIEEFNAKVDDLFRKVSIGRLGYEEMKHALRNLCIQFENDLIKQGLMVESEEFESDTTIVFLCDG